MTEVTMARQCCRVDWHGYCKINESDDEQRRMEKSYMEFNGAPTASKCYGIG